jgi:hypothetical protein
MAAFKLIYARALPIDEDARFLRVLLVNGQSRTMVNVNKVDINQV